MDTDIRILYLEHNKKEAESLVSMLKKSHIAFYLRVAESEEAFFESLENFHPQLVLANFSFPGLEGLKALSLVREKFPQLPFIFISDRTKEELMEKILQKGATDYIRKDRIHRLPEAVHKAMDQAEKRNRLYRAELALKRSESRFRSLVETSLDWIWQVDLKWNFVYNSPRVVNLLGYRPMELTGESFFGTIREEDAGEIVEKLVNSAKQDNPVIKEEIPNVHKDGHIVYMEARAIPHRDNNGHLIGYDGVYRDISQIKEHVMRLDAVANRATNLIELPLLAERMNELEFINKALKVMGEQTDSQRVFIALRTGVEKPLEIFSIQKRTSGSAWTGMEVYHSQEEVWLPFLGDPGRGENQTVGTFQLDTWMTVPVKEGEHWIMLGGAGNSKRKYTSFDQESLLLLSNEVSRLIQYHRQMKEIRENQRKIKEAQTLALLGYWNWDFETGEYNWSGLIYDVLGMHHRESPIGYTGMREYVTPSVRSMLFHDLYLCRKEKKSFQKDLQVYSKKKEKRWVTVRGAPILSEKGLVSGFFGTVQDISQRRKSEEQFISLALAVEQSSESIMLTDLDGKIEYINRAFMKVTGYSREEVLGQNPKFLQSGNTPEESYRGMWATLTKGEPWTGEFHNRRKDGSKLIESAKISPVKQPDGTIVRYMGVKEDITEKKRMEEDLNRYRHHLEKIVVERTEQLVSVLKEAESANLAKQSFLANMSHEIRTPMNAVMGLVHLLKKTSLTVEQSGFVDKIEISSKLLLNLINDILDLSKVESGKMKLESIPIRIPALLANVKSMLSDKAAEKKLDFTIHQEALPENLLGDPTRITQVLLNLTNNAIKFTESGFVRVSVRLEEETEVSATIRFEVQDTGVGFEEEELPRMFHSFEQADSSISRKFGGSGLGLSITRHLAELMGGEADAARNPDRGSTFWFTVNLLKHSEKINHLDEISNPSPLFERMIKRQYGGASILLVEDDSINQEVAMHILEDLSLDVTIADNGEEALKALRDGPPFDLILMDMQMPVMDGLEASREIRNRESGGPIPIIAMTANAYAEDKERCLDAGMNDYVTKPIDPDQLYRTMLKWLNKDSASVIEHILGRATERSPEMVDKVKKLKGLNINHVKTLFGNNLYLYMSLLEKYAKRYEHIAITMDRLCKKKQYKEFRELVHKMKGASGSLGFFETQDILKHLEGQLKNGTIRTSSCLKFCELIQSHIDNVEKVASIHQRKKDDRETIEEPSAEVADLLKNMHKLLSSHDTAIIDVIEEHNHTLTNFLGNEYNQFVNLVWEFDYPSALEILDHNVHSDL